MKQVGRCQLIAGLVFSGSVSGILVKSVSKILGVRAGAPFGTSCSGAPALSPLRHTPPPLSRLPRLPSLDDDDGIVVVVTSDASSRGVVRASRRAEHVGVVLDHPTIPWCWCWCCWQQHHSPTSSSGWWRVTPSASVRHPNVPPQVLLSDVDLVDDGDDGGARRVPSVQPRRDRAQLRRLPIPGRTRCPHGA